MNTTLINDSKKDANKKAIKFVITLFVLYVLFSQGNLFMNSVLSEGGRFRNDFLRENFNYIQWVRSSLIAPATEIIKLFGFHAIHNDSDVMVVKGPYLVVNYSCIGLGVMSFFTAFVLSFPAKLKPKINLFIIGTVMIYTLNVGRIAGLGVLLGFFESQYSNFTYHHEIFNALVYLCIFLLLYFWIKKNTNAKQLKPTTID